MRETILEYERAARPLEADDSERAVMRSALVGLAESFLRGMPDQKAFVSYDSASSHLDGLPIGEDGHDLEALIELLAENVIAPGGHPAASGHLAYLTGGGIYPSALADYLSAVTNKYAGISFTGPGPVAMENRMIRWTADVVGYPKGAGGSIASGGSIANLTAVAAARDAHEVSGERIGRRVVYLTDQAHHCIDKALHLTGVGTAPKRRIRLDERFRMNVGDLERTIEDDRAAGLEPWLIVASAGTTDTGAVDPLGALADVAEREGCWLHVDAAYGGFFLLTNEGRRVMEGISRADSVVLDPHKSLFLPWGAGIVLARDVRHLMAAHSYSGHYLQDAPPDPRSISPSDVSPELTKPFRALRMWLPLMLLGVKPFRAALMEKQLLARYFRARVEELGFEVGPEPDLSTVTFRWSPPGKSLEDSNRMNQEIVEALRQDGRIFLSSTLIDGVYTLRMAALSFRTHLEHIDLALDLLAERVR